MRIDCYIVEDEPRSSAMLKQILLDSAFQVEVLGEASSLEAAAEELIDLAPDVVFLDISMPGKNGTEILDVIPHPKFEIIFTTAYEQYAVKAFELSALDYLLKPLDPRAVEQSLLRFAERSLAFKTRDRLLASGLMPEHNANQKLVIPSNDGYEFIEIADILSCTAESNYTRVNLCDGSFRMLSRSLARIEELLEGKGFIRTHAKYLVNGKHVKKLSKDKQPVLVLSDGSEVMVAQRRRADLLDILSLR